jgi:hypothetical protein
MAVLYVELRGIQRLMGSEKTSLRLSNADSKVIEFKALKFNASSTVGGSYIVGTGRILHF